MIYARNIFAIALTATLVAVGDVVDEYWFSMSLNVPQVLDNTQSKGYRRYQTQRITGPLYVTFGDDGDVGVRFGTLTNHNFSVGGKPVTYAPVEADNVRWNLVGDNGRNIFKTAAISFTAELEPSYAIGEPDEDNSFVLSFAANGNPKRPSGLAAGTQGCGCHGYGHTSPTRRAGPNGATDIVDDVAATYGRWRAVKKARE